MPISTMELMAARLIAGKANLNSVSECNTFLMVRGWSQQDVGDWLLHAIDLPRDMRKMGKKRNVREKIDPSDAFDRMMNAVSGAP